MRRRITAQLFSAALLADLHHALRAARAGLAHSLAKGAYSKATSSLHTETADLDAAAQQYWVARLLPKSVRPAQAVSSRADAPTLDLPEPESSSKTALRGVRFRALSGAGPSGARPEHLRELVAVRDRRVSNSLLGALDNFVAAASKGDLPDAARWVLSSRLVFLRKKTGRAPRPIRVGELWRRVIAKRLLDEHREKSGLPV